MSNAQRVRRVILLEAIIEAERAALIRRQDAYEQLRSLRIIEQAETDLRRLYRGRAGIVST